VCPYSQPNLFDAVSLSSVDACMTPHFVLQGRNWSQ
jgi:hypothetical protein